MTGTARTLRVVTYNIHRCRGMDGRTLPQRTIEVLRSLEADIIALQEVVGAGPRLPGHAEELGAALGMGWRLAPTRRLRGSLFGNMVLTRFPVRYHAQYDLTWKTCEPRACQRIDLAVGNHTLRVFNVHLGTAFLERRQQAASLAAIVLDRRASGPKIVLGDFNEWVRGLATTLLSSRLQSLDLRGHLRRKRTYPGFFPILHLDHIYYQGDVNVVRIHLPRTRRTLVASDHLPLVADLAIRFDR